MKTKKQHKLPRFREDSWGPLIYSSAEQTERLRSSFSSSPKQLCQKLKFAFLTLFFLRGKLFLQWLKALLPSSSVVLVWILKKKRLVLVSPLLNKPSKGNSFLPQELWAHLGHNWKGRWKELWLLSPSASWWRDYREHLGNTNSFKAVWHEESSKNSLFLWDTKTSCE